MRAEPPRSIKVGQVVFVRFSVPGDDGRLTTDKPAVVAERVKGRGQYRGHWKSATPPSERLRLQREDGTPGSWWVDRDAIAIQRIGVTHTGSYRAELVYDYREELYTAFVLYIGRDASGQVVQIPLHEPENEREAQRWFKTFAGSDYDVGQLLAQAGYDEYGNRLR